jgi:hypothetical protein
MATKKNPAAVALGSLGGKQRAKNLTKEQQIEIARKAGIAGGKARAAKKAAQKGTSKKG